MHIYDLFKAVDLHSRRAGDDVFQLCLREDKANVKKRPSFFTEQSSNAGIFLTFALSSRRQS